MSDWKFGPRIVAFFTKHGEDSAGLLGAGLISYGAEQIYRPAGFIIGGFLLLAASWLSARHKAS